MSSDLSAIASATAEARRRRAFCRQACAPSCRQPAHSNPIETSCLLGHKASDQVLFDHYRALATKAQVESYFALRPSASAVKVVRFG
jgi:hypothetical protein